MPNQHSGWSMPNNYYSHEDPDKPEIHQKYMPILRELYPNQNDDEILDKVAENCLTNKTFRISWADHYFNLQSSVPDKLITTAKDLLLLAPFSVVQELATHSLRKLTNINIKHVNKRHPELTLNTSDDVEKLILCTYYLHELATLMTRTIDDIKRRLNHRQLTLDEFDYLNTLSKNHCSSTIDTLPVDIQKKLVEKRVSIQAKEPFEAWLLSQFDESDTPITLDPENRTHQYITQFTSELYHSQQNRLHAAIRLCYQEITTPSELLSLEPRIMNALFDSINQIQNPVYGMISTTDKTKTTLTDLNELYKILSKNGNYDFHALSSLVNLLPYRETLANLKSDRVSLFSSKHKEHLTSLQNNTSFLACFNGTHSKLVSHLLRLDIEHFIRFLALASSAAPPKQINQLLQHLKTNSTSNYVDWQKSKKRKALNALLIFGSIAAPTGAAGLILFFVYYKALSTMDSASAIALCCVALIAAGGGALMHAIEEKSKLSRRFMHHYLKEAIDKSSPRKTSNSSLKLN